MAALIGICGGRSGPLCGAPRAHNVCYKFESLLGLHSADQGEGLLCTRTMGCSDTEVLASLVILVRCETRCDTLTRVSG